MLCSTLTAKLLSLLNFLILSDQSFSSRSIRLFVFCRKSRFFTCVELKIRAQQAIWVRWMWLRHADESRHVKFEEATREVNQCSFKSNYVSFRQYSSLNRFVSYLSSLMIRLFILALARHLLLTLTFTSDSDIHFWLWHSLLTLASTCRYRYRCLLAQVYWVNCSHF